MQDNGNPKANPGHTSAPMPDVFELIASIKDRCGGSTCAGCRDACAYVDGLLAARFEDGQ